MVDNDRDIRKVGMNAIVDTAIAGKDETLAVQTRAVRSQEDVLLLTSDLGIEIASDHGNPGARVVFAKRPDGISLREVSIGLSDWDEFRVTEGLEEAQEVLVFLTSRALEKSKEYMERRRRMAILGVRRSTR